jgi:REP-associated tyrosine transposase
MYNWRKLSEVQRREALALRRGRKLPWHSPPHLDLEGAHQYLISASCFSHASIIGESPERMTQCEADVLEACDKFASAIYAWCILPNHYHVVVRTALIKELRKALGLLHGRSSFNWNGQDDQRGRQVWYNCFERPLKSQRHFWATLNYVHHNPVHHGYVEHWQDWPWSSAERFLKEVGRDRAKEIWDGYPILDYGKKWDK